MYKILLLVAAAYCQTKSDSDKSALNQKIVGLSTVPPLNTSTVSEENVPCATEDGIVGECISSYLCSKNYTLIPEDVDGIDLHFIYNPCPSYTETCCSLEYKRELNNPILPELGPKREGCGWANSNGTGYPIYNTREDETKFGEFPWMVALLKPENDQGVKLIYVGGGSLIHPSVVLTVAHYVVSSQEYHVRAGEWDTQNTKEIYPYQDREVASIQIHKDFNQGNLFYDVALLFLTKAMDLAPNVGVACLPPARLKTDAGTKCIATGWGKDKFGKEGRYSVILKKIELPVVGRSECQDALRLTRLGSVFELHSSFMCAGGEAEKDTCIGDGGSPLVCPIPFAEDRYVQSGIVAWSIGCGMDGIPGAYVDVSVVRDWIDDKIAGKGYDPRTYTY